MTINRRRKNSRTSRKGVEAVELAIVAPILLVLTLGTLEAVEGILLNKKVEVAAHEGARVAVRKNATVEDVRGAIHRYLDSRAVNYDTSSITMTPSVDTAAMLTPITISVSVDVRDNQRMPISFYRFWAGRTIEREVTMFKEFANN